MTQYSKPLKVDPTRETWRETGIFVRAQNSEGKWISTDISTLDKKSLLEWLRSRGGANEWAESTVAIILGHGSFDEKHGYGPVRVVDDYTKNDET